jgi:hypothetical protein
MTKRLLLMLCAFNAFWIGAVIADNVGVGGRAWYGWWDADFSPAGQPYVERIDSTQPNGATEKAGLRTGDWFDWREQSRDTRQRLLSSQPMATQPTVLITHRGARKFIVGLTGSTLGEGEVWVKLALFVPQLIASIWFLGCAFLVAVRRASLSEGRRLALILIFLSVPPLVLVVTSSAASMVFWYATLALNSMVQALLVGLAASFGARSAWRRALEIFAYAAIAASVLILAIGAYGGLTLRTDPMMFGPRFFAALFVWLASVAAVAVVAAIAVASTPDSDRPRAAWLLLPLPLAMLASAAALKFQIVAHTWIAGEFVQILAAIGLLLGAFAVTYALLKRRVLDFEFVLTRTVVVATVSLIVVAAFVLLEWILGTVLSGVSHTEGLIANGALALVLGVSLNFTHQRVDRLVEGVLFRKRRADERALVDFSREAAYVTESDALLDQTIAKVERHTDARNAAILIDGSEGYEAARSFGDNSLAPARENDGAILALKAWHKPLDPHQYDTTLHGALALPMLGRGRLLGVLLLGERAGGESYAPDEVEALSQLAHGVGSALDVLSSSGASSIEGLRESIAAMSKAVASLGEKMDALLRGGSGQERGET